MGRRLLQATESFHPLTWFWVRPSPSPSNCLLIPLGKVPRTNIVLLVLVHGTEC